MAGDQKKKEVDVDGVPNVVFTNNLFLRADNWPTDFAFKDVAPMYGDPLFKNKGSVQLKDYVPANTKLILNKGISVQPIPNDKGI